MKVLLTGIKFIDIDGYASMIAYRYLLRLKGENVKAISSVKTNYSVPSFLIDDDYKLDDYEIAKDDELIMLDVSNPNFFEDFVREEQIVEIIDHHFGFEKYWQEKVNIHTEIMPIGAVATIVAQKYIDANLFDKMPVFIAKQLMAAILDNTLNFTADITRDFDKRIYKKLEQKVNDKDFVNKYFSACEVAAMQNIDTTIKDDIRIEYVNEYLPSVMGQIVLWDVSKILSNLNIIKKYMQRYEDKWICNIISLKESKSYILCSDIGVLNNLKKILNGDTNNYKDILITKAILRKEIIGLAKKGEKL